MKDGLHLDCARMETPKWQQLNGCWLRESAVFLCVYIDQTPLHHLRVQMSGQPSVLKVASRIRVGVPVICATPVRNAGEGLGLVIA